VEGRILLNASVTAPHDCNTNTCFRFVVRLLPVILTAPLLGACMGGLAPRPGPVEVIWMGQPPPYGVPGFGPVPIAYNRPSRPPADNRDEVWPPSSISRRPENDGNSATPVSGSAPQPGSPGPERKPPPRVAEPATLRSPTCGYWRFGCGILWP
jgi:hypothetical protein